MSDANKIKQNYDNSTPRCATCVYCRRTTATPYVERTITKKSGVKKVIKVPVRKHPISNPVVDKCTFGNFIVVPQGLCDEWHGRDGSKLET